jgi:hypothetical protein
VQCNINHQMNTEHSFISKYPLEITPQYSNFWFQHFYINKSHDLSIICYLFIYLFFRLSEYGINCKDDGFQL